MKREPAVTVAAITAAASAIITLLIAFGVPMSEAQSQAILGVVAVLAPIVVGLIARGMVTPAQTVVALEDRGTGRTVAGPAAEQTDGTPVRVDSPPPAVG